jgi:hypothetical protein
MKGVDALIAMVLIIAISITAIFIALQSSNPSTSRAKEVLLLQEGKDNLITIDGAVKNVIGEGEGSTRVINLAISGGSYDVDNSTSSVVFSMESRAQIVGDGVSKIEDGINITGASGRVYLNLSYDSVNIVDSRSFGKGRRAITIRNEGYDAISKKQMIYISTP